MSFPFSGHYNCKACALLIPPNLKRCPHCSEPNPYSKEQLGQRAEYLEHKDPAVPEKLPWLSRTLLMVRPASPLLIGAAITFLFVDFFFPSMMVNLLSQLNQPVGVWLGALYALAILVLVFCTTAIAKF